MTSAPRLNALTIGDVIPGRTYDCDNIQLMMYNAALWNGHRIHYDAPYTTQVEAYPGLVIAGPLIGDWLSQCLMEWLGDAGELRRFSYSNRQAAYVGETLASGGAVATIARESQEVSVELFVKNESGEIVAPGSALVYFGNDR